MFGYIAAFAGGFILGFILICAVIKRERDEKQEWEDYKKWLADEAKKYEERMTKGEKDGADISQ